VALTLLYVEIVRLLQILWLRHSERDELGDLILVSRGRYILA
jgi:hypothetical protein